MTVIACPKSMSVLRLKKLITSVMKTISYLLTSATVVKLNVRWFRRVMLLIFQIQSWIKRRYHSHKIVSWISKDHGFKIVQWACKLFSLRNSMRNGKISVPADFIGFKNTIINQWIYDVELATWCIFFRNTRHQHEFNCPWMITYGKRSLPTISSKLSETSIWNGM